MFWSKNKVEMKRGRIEKVTTFQISDSISLEPGILSAVNCLFNNWMNACMYAWKTMTDEWLLSYPTSSPLCRPKPHDCSRVFLPGRNVWVMGDSTLPHTLSPPCSGSFPHSSMSSSWQYCFKVDAELMSLFLSCVWKWISPFFAITLWPLRCRNMSTSFNEVAIFGVSEHCSIFSICENLPIFLLVIICTLLLCSHGAITV